MANTIPPKTDATVRISFTSLIYYKSKSVTILILGIILSLRVIYFFDGTLPVCPKELF